VFSPLSCLHSLSLLYFQVDASNRGLIGFMNVMIRSVGGPTSFSGIISSSSPTAVNTLIPGIPQLFHLSSHSTIHCSSLINTKDNSTILITSFNPVVPTLTAKLPSTATNSVLKASNGVLLYHPLNSDIGKNVEFSFSSPNTSVVSIVVHESMNYDVSPIFLMSGLAQVDYVLAKTSHYYYFNVPPNINTDVKFILESSDVSILRALGFSYVFCGFLLSFSLRISFLVSLPSCFLSLLSHSFCSALHNPVPSLFITSLHVSSLGRC
jgi:hypothetical protein